VKLVQGHFAIGTWHKPEWWFRYYPQRWAIMVRVRLTWVTVNFSIITL